MSCRQIEKYEEIQQGISELKKKLGGERRNSNI